MKLFNFFSTQKEANINLSEDDIITAKAYFDKISDEANTKQKGVWKFNVNSLDSYQELKSENSILKRKIAFYSCFLIACYEKNSASVHYNLIRVTTPLLSLLFRSDINFTEADYSYFISEIVKSCRHHNYSYYFPYTPFITSIEKFKEKNGFSEQFKETLQLLLRNDSYKESLLVNARIDRLLNEKVLENDFNLEDYLTNKDTVGIHLFKYFQDNTNEKNELLKLLADEFDKSIPTKKWILRATEIVKNIGKEAILKFGISAMDETITRLKELHKIDQLWNLNIDEERADYLRSNRWFFDKNEQILRGLAWMTPIIDSFLYNEKIAELGIIAYKKKTGIGALLPKIGSACIYAVAQLPYQVGTSYLTIFSQKIKYSNANKLIEKYFVESAKKSGKTVDEIEEEAIPTLGFHKEGFFEENFGDIKAILKITDERKTEIQWYNEGKLQKSVPISVKESFPNELKVFQQKSKKASEILAIQMSKMEGFYLKKRSWNFAVWKKVYLEHGILSILIKKLIWLFENNDKKTTAIYFENQFIDNQGNIVDWIDENTIIKLWHPLGFEPEYVLKWRDFLNEKQIVQPFKQAFREVYILTDAELNTQTYSNRFAAHILKNYQFGALCKIRNWNGYNQFHDGGIPELNLKEWGISVQFWVDFLNTENWGDYISTDQVKFIKNREQLNMIDVPPIVFSETMRDVDLFVGVCSIGNDPNWRDGGNRFGNDYWQSYSFGDLGELAKTRKNVLEKLIPRLKIAKIAEIKDKFMVIKGKLKTYKIHIGSGNILMEPNDQYLCIVPDRSAKSSKTENVFLPFEGDSVLSIILSKAFLLADDDKITDPTITRQIR